MPFLTTITTLSTVAAPLLAAGLPVSHPGSLEGVPAVTGWHVYNDRRGGTAAVVVLDFANLGREAQGQLWSRVLATLSAAGMTTESTGEFRATVYAA